jgi:hypothetical protein
MATIVPWDGFETYIAGELARSARGARHGVGRRSHALLQNRAAVVAKLRFATGQDWHERDLLPGVLL